MTKESSDGTSFSIDEIKASMEAPEPSIDESKGTEEETSINNETEALDSPEGEATTNVEDKPEGEAGGEGKQSESKVIAKLGEDRKRYAEALIDLAVDDPKARETVKEMMESDPETEKYIKTKFGKQYDAIKEGTEIEPPKVLSEEEIENIRHEERVKAKAEAIKQAFEEGQNKAIEDFAELKSFTLEEADALKDHVDLLKAKYSLEEALTLAGKIVNESKMKTSSSNPPVSAGGTVNKEPLDSKIDGDAAIIAAKLGRKPDDKSLVEGLQKLKANLSEDGTRLTL